MKLFTSTEYQQLLENGKHGNCGKDHVPVVKWQTDDNYCTWFVTEMVNEHMAFGLKILGNNLPEIDYILRSELSAIENCLGTIISRDKDFKPKYPMTYYMIAAL
jgi:hypothetical protein